jgi:anti-sigma factor RsiW
MKPTVDPLQVDAFVDDELDLSNRLEFEARLRHDPELREQVDSLRQMRIVVRERADHHAAPDALRLRLAQMVEAEGATTRSVHSRWTGWIGRWWRARPVAAGFSLALVAVLATNLAWWRLGDDTELRDEVVASHVRASLAEHLTDVASSDHHTVKPWLSSRLDFSPPVAELQVPGSLFVGGRVDYLDGRPVAALVYRQGQHIVTSFVWPGTDGNSDVRFTNQRGFELAHWTHDGMNHWVISDVNRDEFKTVVRAIQQE